MTYKDLKNLIASNKLKQALTFLKKNKTTAQQATLIEAHLNELTSKTISGIISNGNAPLTSSLLSNEKQTPFKKRKEIIAALVTIMGFTLKDFLPFNFSDEDIDLTIVIRGHEGKTDLIPQPSHKAQVIVDFGNKNIQPKTLGDFEEVSLEGVPNNWKAEKFTVMMEGTEYFELAALYSQYIFDGKPVYINAQRISAIKSTVQELADEFIPIANTKVVIDRAKLLTTQTNQYGKFEIKIPQNKSKERHEILVEKEGYEKPLEPFRTRSAQVSN